MTPADLDAIEARAKAASIHVGLIADEQCIRLVAEVRRLRAALLVAAEQEREACAAVVGTLAEVEFDNEPEFSAVLRCEYAIRARHETP